VLNSKVVSLKKNCAKLKSKCLKVPNYAYSNRYLQGEERETVEHKLKILTREFKYLIGRLTYINNFVFAVQQIKEAHEHCTHLQITQANPLTKIYKRVQFSHVELKDTYSP